MIFELPDEAAVAAFARIAIFLFVLLYGWSYRRRYHWPIGLGCVLGIAANVTLVAGDLSLQGYFGLLFTVIAAWVFIDAIRNDPEALKAHLGAMEAKWSDERHDLINDLTGLRGRNIYLQQSLDDLRQETDPKPPPAAGPDF